MSLKWDIPEPWASLLACQLYLPPHRQTDSWGWHSHLGPPWYSPFSAQSGPDSLWGYCHRSHVEGQTSVNPCGLRFAFPPTECSGPDLLFRRGIASLHLNVKHMDLNSRLNTVQGKLLRDYADENSCLIFGLDSPTTKPYNYGCRSHLALRGAVVTRNSGVPELRGTPGCGSHPEFRMPESPGTPRCRSHPVLRVDGVTRNYGVPKSPGIPVCLSYSERWYAAVIRKSGVPEPPGTSETGVQQLWVVSNPLVRFTGVTVSGFESRCF